MQRISMVCALQLPTTHQLSTDKNLQKKAKRTLFRTSLQLPNPIKRKYRFPQTERYLARYKQTLETGNLFSIVWKHLE